MGRLLTNDCPICGEKKCARIKDTKYRDPRTLEGDLEYARTRTFECRACRSIYKTIEIDITDFERIVMSTKFYEMKYKQAVGVVTSLEHRLSSMLKSLKVLRLNDED